MTPCDSMRLLVSHTCGASTLLLLLSSIVIVATAQHAEDNIVNEFGDDYTWSSPDIPQFSNLEVDTVTGRVYIGAVNRLYQLSPDLTLTESAVTGPKEDSPMCSSVLPECSDSFKKLTDNVNKALVIDYAESRLIECGSLFQGDLSEELSTINLQHA